MTRLTGPRAPVRATLLTIVCVFLAVLTAPAHAREPGPRGDIEAAALPREARDVLALIHAGGPFRYERDGVTFGNRERSLPPRRRGYYHEYTVATPGVRTRGARRIVCGGARATPEVCYYSDDHYATFRRIRE
ncbi:MAG TPA: ribonuclease domain-containing protein [Casimicrobiaceae bacterium]|nr:ribonuclease domain-containing protein [Casimicrobiaceae bacterium]